MYNRTHLIIIAALTVALLLTIGKCSHIAGNADANTIALTDSITYFQNKLGTTTASIKTLQLEKDQVKDLLLKKDKQLAELSKEFLQLHTITKYSTVTKYDTIKVAYTDTVPCVFERSGAINKQWYSFGYRANQKGVEFDTLSIPNTATIITGTKRKWFLGKEVVTTDITNSNPNIKVTDLKAAEIVLPVPWFRKWYVWLAAGAVGGLFIK